MEIVKPNPEQFLLPPGAEEVTYAEDQPQYLPLPVIKTLDGRVVCQWQPDANDLALLNNGAPITVMMLTCNRPLQPLCVTVGGMDLRE
jgi:hypothetical protein